MKTLPKHRGFSLIEVVFAIGIISFAFVAIFGMLPVGLTTASDSADSTRASQITQRLVSEVQQTPFDKLGLLFGQLRYFDAEGEEIPAATATGSSGLAGYIYTAVVDSATDSVKVSNAAGVGISEVLTRLVIIKIAKNRLVTALGANEKPLAQTAFAVADINL